MAAENARRECSLLCLPCARRGHSGGEGKPVVVLSRGVCSCARCIAGALGEVTFLGGPPTDEGTDMFPNGTWNMNFNWRYMYNGLVSRQIHNKWIQGAHSALVP